MSVNVPEEREKKRDVKLVSVTENVNVIRTKEADAPFTVNIALD